MIRISIPIASPTAPPVSSSSRRALTRQHGADGEPVAHRLSPRARSSRSVCRGGGGPRQPPSPMGDRAWRRRAPRPRDHRPVAAHDPHGFEDPAAAELRGRVPRQVRRRRYSSPPASCAPTSTCGESAEQSPARSPLSTTPRRRFARIRARVGDADPSLTVAYWLPGRRSLRRHAGPASSRSDLGTQRSSRRRWFAMAHRRCDQPPERSVRARTCARSRPSSGARQRAPASRGPRADERASRIPGADRRSRGRTTPQLERNLHDGAQQSLLGLTYDLRRARADAAANGHHDLVALCDHARERSRASVRRVAPTGTRDLPRRAQPRGPRRGHHIDRRDGADSGHVRMHGHRAPAAAVETAVYVVVADGIDAVVAVPERRASRSPSLASTMTSSSR